ncbi:Protein of unknown function [Persephonella hydrogeniphila]|uniref:DUF2628 domain-containing protein n=1 Tax=Persephonella hydrogeniphila TaxID=198703 RepID=A0A285NJK6_9AQUI|nr:DUF2628 domain-containing protein [Persephonella hydrogeniphila]SNZ09692.1 Protein of unknown function [Persephonella hydrogeniphila]
MDKWEKYRIFIGDRADYYIEKFKKFEETGSVLSWNWAAFFFGLLWMLYRKMYLYSAIFIILVLFFIGALVYFNLYNNLVMFGIQLWLYVGFGAFGNYIYYTYVESKVSKIEKETEDPEKLKILLARKGGTDKISPVLFFLIIFILQILSYMPK